MKIDSVSFKAASVSKTAEAAINHRTVSEEAGKIIEGFVSKYTKSPLIIELSTIKNSERLQAEIKYRSHRETMKESFFSKIFNDPSVFLENLSERIDNIEEVFLGRLSRKLY